MKTEAQKKAQKRWKEKNREDIREYDRNWKREKYATDSEFRKKVREKAIQLRQADPEKYQRLAREFYARRWKDSVFREKECVRARQYRVDNIEGCKARNKLNTEVRAGRIQRPDKCSWCGKLNCRIEAHHEDYSRPLDVEWLCVSCHSKLRLDLNSYFWNDKNL